MDKVSKNGTETNTHFVAPKISNYLVQFKFGDFLKSDYFIANLFIKGLILLNLFNVQCFSMVSAIQISKIFPPKDLEKYRRSKYACAAFLNFIY